MLNKTALILIVIGLVIIGYASLQRMTGHQSEKAALARIKKELEEREATEIKLAELSFQHGQTIGVLEIPAINKELPIVEGTDEEALKHGVGHFTNTVYPGEKDQILLSGHRDTVFTGLDNLQNGDTIIVKMAHGTFTYSITGTEIVDEDDTTIIRSTAPEEILTLSTCYPFTYIGNAPQRYIVYAERD
ncbi:class D sortase [Sporosarcina saromensis]|uniref:Class D sortase n=1 Tax=Sporosarcina saromensis TaxID=359365 RepID=A0ABU4G823_9BACL|nr:class D sortase [Sporosarcina saromensis]MDW0113119.1 class D sortase [Sporosarcina saromensis]